MSSGPSIAAGLSALALTSAVIQALRAAGSPDELGCLMATATREMGFRHYALIHHEDLRTPRGNLVNIKDYPAAVSERLIGQNRYRRDPVIRGCIFADSAFMWSGLSRIIQLDRQDQASLEFGAREGLNEGITVPYTRHGARRGSCTFAGTKRPEQVHEFLGAAQMIGIFAFQAAVRLVGDAIPPFVRPRLYPRPRDCVVLAGRGYSNKEIARALGLTPRTVDCYMTEARRLLGAHDRTELVVSAVLAGEVELHEIANRRSG